MSDEALAETYLDRAQQALDSISDGTHDAQSMRWTVAHALAAAERARVVALLEAEQLEWRSGTSHDDLLVHLLKLVRAQ